MTEQQDVPLRLQARVEGRVQGVGFRYFVYQAAQELGLTGWVRNTYDGAVEVTAEGSRKNLETMIFFLRKGPRSSFVSDLQTEWKKANGEFERFDISATF